MKNENENLGLTALMLEVGVVIVICLIILARLQKGDGRKEVPSPTVTPTMAAAPTDVPTVTPTVTQTAMPTNEPTAYRESFTKTCTIKEAEPGHQYKPFTLFWTCGLKGLAADKGETEWTNN